MDGADTGGLSGTGVVKSDAFASRLAPTGECFSRWDRACSRRGWHCQPLHRRKMNPERRPAHR
ncbi:hypothetical protein E5170_12465 [Pseudomonas atacamensis]|uniref:Uncharacterized protein n=1 Tax=Pseudomonas atacamensis TaxID=2565368 RepID=A0AAQ2I1B8_9PSED|nr:hypothetical protein E5170_12465 [Pseudomonas atacamensis]